MKRLLSVLVIMSVLILTFSACDKGEGVPFLTTKSHTTTAANTAKVTIPEGYTLLQIADELEKSGVCSADEFLTVCNTPRDDIDIEIENADKRVFQLEGYLFPDTYEFYLNCDAESVVKKFINNFNEKITDEIKKQTEEKGFTVDEIIILASMIQKECDEDFDECANVSSVFHNRLKRSDFSKLQSDPTSFYIKRTLGEYLGYDSNLKLEQQSEKVQWYMNNYSTYYCEGLPVGPICNPGMKAIRAALNPADTKYVYFLTDDTCKNFYYAETYSRHLKNGRDAGIIK